MNARIRAAFAIAAPVVALVAFGWVCLRDPSIRFLAQKRGADWILFPSAVDIAAHEQAKLDATFRREFTIPEPAADASASLRAATSVRLSINGAAVDLPAISNWKNEVTVNVARFLKAGSNTIEARVFNEAGPPALALRFRCGAVAFGTDSAWVVSFAGSDFRNAAQASDARIRSRWSAIGGGESPWQSAGRVWPAWLGVFAALALLAWTCARFRERIDPRWFVAIFAVAWLVLFWNNSRLLPASVVGFDAESHLQYIAFLQQRHALPLPTDGVQMFQAPLFYLVAAATLSLCGLSAADPGAVLVLRAITMLFGIAHVVVVFAALRLLWPSKPARQIVGTLLAAFVPMNLYLSHYCTNETLAALLVSLGVYQCIRILKSTDARWLMFALLGLTLGAALATKFTAVLAIPWMIAALAWRFRGDVRHIAGKFVLLAACIAVPGGAHYVRVFRATGALVVGGWDAATGRAWWQEDGYRVWEYFARFGAVFSKPFFGAAGASFPDGIFSTLWGDGLCAGVPTLLARVPWNYNLMAAGYVLAVLPTLAVLVGGAVMLARFIARGRAERFLLLALVFAAAVGVIFLNLRVPSYASVKAFYALFALVPFAAFGALGWDAFARKSRAARMAATALLGLWAVNSFASVWIRPSAEHEIFLAINAGQKDIDGATRHLRRATELEPANATAHRLLAWALDSGGHADDALESAKRCVALAPEDPANHAQLATVFARRGELATAIPELQRAAALGTQDPGAFKLLATCRLQGGDDEEAIAAARNGLTVSPYNAELHYLLGAALARRGQLLDATNQFAYALMLRGDFAEARAAMRAALIASLVDPAVLMQYEATIPEYASLFDAIAWIRATHPDAAFRDGAAALRLAARARDMSHSDRERVAKTMAAAYAEIGDFDAAIKIAEIEAGRSADVDQMVAEFRERRPIREQPQP